MVMLGEYSAVVTEKAHPRKFACAGVSTRGLPDVCNPIGKLMHRYFFSLV